MYVRWNNVRSSGFRVMEVVKVEFYSRTCFFCMNELSRMLNNVNAGCFVGASLVNHTGMDN